MPSGAAVAAVASSGAKRSAFRTDIQGLRAIAVVLVVLDHAFHWPLGGFVGVDVFYVISGFLITGLLLKELDQTGSVSLRAFYARRARRILPAAVLVLAVTVTMAFAVWFLPRAIQTLLDSISALLFVSNWHFVAIGTDYLQADGAVSPVQHYWSLSIEEQFYAVWPLALLLLFTLVRGSRRILLAVVVAGIGVSLGWAAYRTGTDPSAAYFDTFARSWELLVGALLAFTGTAAAVLGKRVRSTLAIVGLALIIVGAVIVTPDWGIPFPWVAPAVIGAALVIWANAGAGSWTLLGNPVSQWLGDVSYSLYLWHFPVLIFAFSILGESWWVALACIPVMLILAELSRRFVERPILKSSFLSGWARARNDRTFNPKDLAVGIVVLVAIVVLSVAQLRGPGVIRSADSVAKYVAADRVEANGAATGIEARRVEVQTALASTEWPAAVRAHLDRLFATQQPDAMSTEAPGCRNDVFTRDVPLVCGEDTADEVMLVGDSVALSWMPTLDALAARGLDATGVGYANCSLFDVDVTNGAGAPGFEAACAERRETMFDLIEAHAPEVVVLSASETAITYTGLPLDDATVAWEEGAERTLERLSDVPLVVVLGNPPITVHPQACAARISSPASCEMDLSERYVQKAEAEQAAVEQFANAVYIDTRDWFCFDGACPAFIGDQMVRTDAGHLTQAAATSAGPLLDEALRRKGF
ncbi:acyltransferase [Microbacterium trichothecenolyticum]|uniref:acyltransferase family protein n=1 Tax=Microbacterium trichothecenolyticum TaxID=69370 RepID=UPI001C6EEC3E|nr:acyltransferase family protein [Microbacterium trichothecenolyticum]MBW9118899.1 acyltransferase [Microbacterium trichothecenolyticum]